MDLGSLNESSAKLAAFTVIICGGRVSQYTYTNKKDNKRTTAHKFEAWLVGTKAESYCVGFVKGTPAAVQKAAQDYPNASVWTLSKPALDTYTAANYISTPVPFRVDLA